ncbi:MAG: hypothetical protein DLM50_09320 [Candidatus Meridianibacter frigidus]|nr:MAG: hypothetical protein DLM50_09320 [Candidatus Eremiobacteraeota bacterium]
MNGNLHARAEVLAGAIALGEATDEQRIEYRAHIASCEGCLQSLGGERELERTHAYVGLAREAEVWEPDVRAPLLDRMNHAPRRVLRYGLGFLGVCLLISLIGHVVIGSGMALNQIKPTLDDPLVINYEGNRVVIERRSVRDRKPAVAAPALPRMVVSNTVVVLPRAPQKPAPNAPVSIRIKPQRAHVTTTRRELAMTAPAPVAAVTNSGKPASNIPIWRRSPRAALAEATVGPIAAHAEAIHNTLTVAPAYATRDAEPEGGEAAIMPRPNQIAYSEGAEGTTAFEVLVDEQGNAVKCVITKSSGWPVLDDAACAAAKRVHYRAKTTNGRPVQGVYRDAFTFRAAQPPE